MEAMCPTHRPAKKIWGAWHLEMDEQ